jgi:HlyD family secretion protein
VVWQARKTANAAPSYTTQTVARGNLTLSVTANGTLQPTRSISIGSELSGTVLKVNVDVNDPIKKGQVLVELDTAKLRDQILRSGRRLRPPPPRSQQTVATVRKPQPAWRASKKWRGCRAARCRRRPNSTVPVADAGTRYRRRGQRPRQASMKLRAALSTDQINLSKASIRAPADGVVLTRSVDPGNAVAASLQAVTLFTVAEDLTRLRLGCMWTRPMSARSKWARKPVSPSAPTRRASSRRDHARRLRLDHHRQRRHLPDLPGRGQRRPEPAPRHDRHRHHRRNQRKDVLLVPNTALRFTPTAAATVAAKAGMTASLMPRMPGSKTRNRPPPAPAPQAPGRSGCCRRAAMAVWRWP